MGHGASIWPDGHAAAPEAQSVLKADAIDQNHRRAKQLRKGFGDLLVGLGGVDFRLGNAARGRVGHTDQQIDLFGLHDGRGREVPKIFTNQNADASESAGVERRETLASGEFHLVSLVAREPVETRVNYRVIRGDQVARQSGRIEAVKISVLGRPAHDAQSETFEFLGLRDLALILDPATRMPLEIRGKVEFASKDRGR